jgi:hypothetical protein
MGDSENATSWKTEKSWFDSWQHNRFVFVSKVRTVSGIYPAPYSKGTGFSFPRDEVAML